jgi:hypothetical protein
MNVSLRLLWPLLAAVPLLFGCGASDTVEIPKENLTPPSRDQAASMDAQPSALKPLPR